ncbi:leucine-rich repeat domain-containing protein [Treponema lecithinolyticum]|uniref:Leucine Rich repeat-containing domain protein n=1 Tax=Treponema lecithinolyticum ATCC 700332 TaxID=1321815 RepID=A0ABN0NYR4_TRELE|nr:leucine-rich repeat domain-containing protein [Treponema lecithinolyticum]ERJ93052.1 leucine Rich repeat-containing domain protein [Treponema lecithinolyticum ATCC 700332]
MTKFRAKHKAPAFLGAALMLLIALMFTACKQPASAEKPEPPAPPAPPKHAVTFSVEGTPPNGTLKAILGTSEITSGDKVEEGKWVIFTAKADEGYRVKEWKVDGNAILGNKTNTYACNVTKPCAITVSFEPYSVKLTLSPDKNTVKVKAKTKDGSAMKVEGCTVTELTSDVETTLTAIGTKVTLIGNITELDCRGEETPGGNRPLIALDVTGCTALQKFDCRFNFITELDVQGLTALQELYCNSNMLTVLDVRGLTKLEKLYCSATQLTALNVSDCTALKELICNDNELSTLNASGLTKLQKLNCRNNKITSLDVSGLTELQELYCNSNKIPKLNVQGLTKLQQLKCGGNQLASLNVQGLTELQQLDCASNQLSSLNVQGCTALKSLLCFRNKLNADVFTKLFNDLPAREASDGAWARVYMKGTNVTEGNCTDFTQPDPLKKAFEDAKNIKHWKMQKVNGAFVPSDI